MQPLEVFSLFKKTLWNRLSWESCKSFKNAFLTEHLHATAFVSTFQVLIFQNSVLLEDLDTLKWD